MFILHTIASLNTSSGGTSTCTYDLVTALNQNGCATDVLTLHPKFPEEKLIGEDSFIHATKNDARMPLRISCNLRRELQKGNYDLYHTNGLWLDINHATCVHARKTGKPCIISPHGMLYPQAMERSAWKKNLMLALGHRKDIRQASCIHATCTREMEYSRSLGFNTPVAVIPNPVSIPDYIHTVQRHEDGPFRIGFLGRLHPRKHVHDLIAAWSRLGDRVKDGELLIIGLGDDAYIRQLHDQVAALNLNNITFTGFLSGKQKFQALASLTALFVPSDFENFGMIIPEALIVGTPVMASLGTPWEELNTQRCGWWCNNDIDTLSEHIDMALQLTTEEQTAMGNRGRQLILQNYTASEIALQMKTVYEYLCHGGIKPDCIHHA